MHGDAHRLAALGALLQGLSERGVPVQTQAMVPHTSAIVRPVLGTGHLLLPQSGQWAGPWGLASCSDATAGCGLWPLQRAAVAHAAAHLLYSTPGASPGQLKPMGLAVASALEDARVEALLAQRFPGVRAWFRECDGALDPLQGTDFLALIARLGRALRNERHHDANAWVRKAHTLFEQACRTHGLEDGAAFRYIASLLANDLGQMRLRFNDRTYAVPEPWRDDNSYLWQHAATQEDATDTLHTPAPPAPSPAGSNASAENAAEPAPTVAHHHYPEWDYRLQRHRPAWCTVVEQAFAPSLHGAHPPHAPAPRLALRHIPRAHRARRIPRQPEGEDIDLNAAIETLVERRTGLQPEGHVFTRPGRNERRCSLLLLLDLSASANDTAPRSGRTVLALEKEAALLLASAALHHGDRIAVHGFCSDTRHAVHYQRLLEFGAPLHSAIAPLHHARAAYSTRIGAALRHATHCMASETTDHRAIVLLTDGEPSDIDVFDPRHLRQDTHAAVREAHRHGVDCYCLALGASVPASLGALFSRGHYRIAHTPEQLPGSLIGLYQKIGGA